MGGATTIRYAAASGVPDGVVTIGAFADYRRFVYPSTALSFRLAFTPPLGSTFTRVTRNTRLGQIRALDGQPREVVSRILKEFEAQGLVQLERGRILILDRDRLMRLAWPHEPL